MLTHSLIPLIGGTPPTWFREILLSAAVAVRTIAVFAVAVAFGVVVAIKIDGGNLWVAAALAAGLLLFVVLPVRLWWVTSHSR